MGSGQALMGSGPHFNKCGPDPISLRWRVTLWIAKLCDMQASSSWLIGCYVR
jgi:hypothetical protein